jgi:hypothetical protein
LYLPQCLLCCISATVSAAVYQSMPLYTWEIWGSPEMVEWCWQWWMMGGEWKFVNESTQMTQCISKHSPILSSSFDGLLTTCKSSG